MTVSSKIPLYLFEVLEAEFSALHEEDPANGSAIKLPDPGYPDKFREVFPTYDWTFHASHIKDASAFISQFELPAEQNLPLPLRTAAGRFTRVKERVIRFAKRVGGALYGSRPAGATDPDKLAKNKLKDYLRSEVKRESRASDAETVAGALNKFLKDPNLFDEQRFSNYWLNNATRGMRDIHISRALVPLPTRSVNGPLTNGDLAHFNRLLLEDAFPQSLEKIHRIRLAAIYQRIHEKQQTALCLSGGGIRSGTFALGLLQGLARHNLLSRFHYLSTVSGGGYIGSWLAAWIHRHPLGLKGVTAELANATPITKVDPDPDTIRYLRRYSNFITPKVGLLSADTWTFLSIYLRNLLLNWLVFIPLLLAVLMLPRFIVSITIAPIEPNFSWDFLPGTSDNFAFPARYIFLVVGFITTVWGIAYIMFNRPTVREELRQASSFWRRKSSQQHFLRWCLLPLAVAAFSLTTYWAWSSQNKRLPKDFSSLLIFGLATTLSAWLVSSWVLGRLRSVRAVLNLRFKGIVTRDLIALLLAGAVGGALLWALTKSFDPFAEKALAGCASISTGWTWLTWKVEMYACLAAPAFLLVFLSGATLYIGLSSKSTRVDDEDREWWARLSAWVLIVILGWIVFTILVILGPIALLHAPKWLAPLGGISGIVAAVAGRSAKTPGISKSSKDDPAKSGFLGAVMGKALPLLAMIFIGFLVIVLSLATTGIIQQLAYTLPASAMSYLNSQADLGTYLRCIYLDVPGRDYWEQTKIAHMSVLHLTSFRFVLSLGLVFFVFGFGVSLLMNLNIFSLHAGYRNRLIRAFLGASRPDHQRKPNPFTGFDPADNISMHELRPDLFDEDDFPEAVTLADRLLNKTSPDGLPKEAAEISKYLSDRGLLPNLKSLPDPRSFSVRLLAALRKDLNGALQDPDLCKSFPQLVRVETGSAKSAACISSNRSLFESAFPKLIKREGSSEPYRLMPVINTTLNLVGGDNLAWQQRKAEPFSVSPLYAGCFRLGYRDSRFYGGRDTGGISIGTAAAISGAAASSNMGYYTTSAVLSLVLTFFNVRLGWWLGNPGTAGNETYDLRAPTSSVAPILDEALGMTDDENKYVYLTDGGHFENLGLYEMVLRRCHVIIVSDAAADGEYRFGDLGNAIRKVRIDLGVPIEFTAMPIFKSKAGETKTGLHWAVGKIRYSCIDGKDAKDGLLLYIKPAVYGNEPRDVLEYKQSHPAFPHQSTADQFFDEPQFESYRILGSHICDEICGAENVPLELEKAISNAVKELLKTRADGAADPELEEWWDKWKPSASQK